MVAGSSLKMSASPLPLTMSSENQKAGSESAFCSFTMRGLAVMGRIGEPREVGKPFIANAESSASASQYSDDADNLAHDYSIGFWHPHLTNWANHADALCGDLVLTIVFSLSEQQEKCA